MPRADQFVFSVSPPKVIQCAMPRKSPNVFTTNFINLSKQQKSDFLGVHVYHGLADDAKFKSSLFPRLSKRKFSSPLFTNERKFRERRERKLLTSKLSQQFIVCHICGSLRVIKRVAPTTIAVAIQFPPRPRCLRFRHGLDPLLLLAQRNRIYSQISASTRHRSISMSDFALNSKTLFRTYRDAVVNLRETVEVAGKFGKSFILPTTGS